MVVAVAGWGPGCGVAAVAVVAVSAGFGSPAVEFHDDPRAGDPPAPEPPAQAVPDLPPGAGTDSASVVLGAGIPAWVADKLAGQPWFTEPQLSLRALITHAQAGEWTVNDRARTRRLLWLWGPAAIARAGAWSILRVWLRGEAPRFGDEQPPVRNVLHAGQESGALPLLWVCIAYLPARIASQIADYAARTGVALLMVWLLANAAGFPEWVTVSYWWSVVSAWAAGTAGAAGSVGTQVAPVAGKVFGTVLLLLAALWMLRNKLHK